jgi:hypothetical protein
MNGPGCPLQLVDAAQKRVARSVPRGKSRHCHAAITCDLHGEATSWAVRSRTFEASFGDFAGIAHAIGLGSAADAVKLASRGCGIGADDLVFTVSHGSRDRRGNPTGCCDGDGRVEPGSYTIAARELSRRLYKVPPIGPRQSYRCTSKASRLTCPPSPTGV